MKLAKIIFVSLCLLLVFTAFYNNETLKYKLIGNGQVVEPARSPMASKERPFPNCSKLTRDMLSHTPLQNKLQGNIDVTTFERSGCFVINSRKSGLYRIVHKANFKGVTCNRTQKRFLTSYENGTRVSLSFNFSIN